MQKKDVIERKKREKGNRRTQRAREKETEMMWWVGGGSGKILVKNEQSKAEICLTIRALFEYIIDIMRSRDILFVCREYKCHTKNVYT